jgi:hypothetical protein
MTSNTFRSLHESPRGFNHRFVVSAEDLTESTDNTAQAITLITLPAGTVIKSAAYYLKTPLADASDAALNTTTITVGDSADADRCINSSELNVNGTEVLYAVNDAAKLPFVTTASTAVTATFGSMAAKDLASIDTGEVWVYLETADLTSLT